MLKQSNLVLCSIAVYLALYAFLALVVKPAWMYDRDGSLRQFGLGTRRKTVLPLWLVALLGGLLSYVGVGYASRQRLL